MLYSKGRFRFIQFIYIDTENLDIFFTSDETFFRKSLNCFLVIPTSTTHVSQLISVYNVSIFIVIQIFFIKSHYVMIGIVITIQMHFYIKLYIYIQGFSKETHVSQKSKIFLINSVMIRKAKCQLLIFKQSGVFYGKHRRFFFFTYHHVFQAHTHISRQKRKRFKQWKVRRQT